jgi:ankyrin repeat protein
MQPMKMLTSFPLELVLLVLDNLDVSSLSTLLFTLPALTSTILQNFPSALRSHYGLLHASAKLNHTNVLGLLLSHPLTAGTQEAKDALGYTPLHCAVRGQARESISLLLSAGANPNTRDLAGSSPLETAAQIGDRHIVSLLLAVPHTIVARAHSQPSALEIAAELGDELMVKQLLPSFSPHTERAQMALVSAIVGNHIHIVRMLLRHTHVSAYTADAQGVLPLHCAARCGAVDIGKMLLLEPGVKERIDERDAYGFTSMQWAGLSGCCEFVNLLFDGGADVGVDVGVDVDVDVDVDMDMDVDVDSHAPVPVAVTATCHRHRQWLGFDID